MKINNILKLIISIGVSELAGVVGSFFTVSAIPVWYAGLVKPALNPPGWIFGPVWIILYALMGVAAWLVWKQLDGADSSGKGKIKAGLVVFGIQLFLNAIWPIIFFGFKDTYGALIDIILLWFAIAYTITIFYQISKPAAYLLVLYILWVTFAAYLNYSICLLN